MATKKEQLEVEVQRLREEVLMLRGQVAAYKEIATRAIGEERTVGNGGRHERTRRAFHAFGSMTTKQHCAYQMLMRGASNAEIAERMGVTESTAKVYVRGIMKKLGVNTRSQVIMATKDAFDEIGEHEYLGVAGIPKDWDATWTPDDPYRAKYMTE